MKQSILTWPRADTRAKRIWVMLCIGYFAVAAGYFLLAPLSPVTVGIVLSPVVVEYAGLYLMILYDSLRTRGGPSTAGMSCSTCGEPVKCICGEAGGLTDAD